MLKVLSFVVFVPIISLFSVSANPLPRPECGPQQNNLPDWQNDGGCICISGSWHSDAQKCMSDDEYQIWSSNNNNAPTITSGDSSQLTSGGGGYYLTWYDPSVGIGFCGGQNEPGDIVVAVNYHIMQNSQSWCGRSVIITASNGQSVTAKVVDQCGSSESNPCNPERQDIEPQIVDATKGVWNALGVSTDVGIDQVSIQFL